MSRRPTVQWLYMVEGGTILTQKQNWALTRWYIYYIFGSHD